MECSIQGLGLRASGFCRSCLCSWLWFRRAPAQGPWGFRLSALVCDNLHEWRDLGCIVFTRTYCRLLLDSYLPKKSQNTQQVADLGSGCISSKVA